MEIFFGIIAVGAFIFVLYKITNPIIADKEKKKSKQERAERSYYASKLKSASSISGYKKSPSQYEFDPDLWKYETVKCPYCKKVITVKTYHMIGYNSPRFVKAITGELFNVACPFCREMFCYEYATAIHTPTYSILCVQQNLDRDSLQQVADITRDYVKKGALFRVVRNVSEMKEKVYIFNANLDDRAIELLKKLYALNLAVIESNDRINIGDPYFDGKNIVIPYYNVDLDEDMDRHYNIDKKEYQDQINIIQELNISPNENVFDGDWATDVVKNHIFEDFFEAETE